MSEPTKRPMADAPGVVRSCKYCGQQIYFVLFGATLLAVDEKPIETYEINGDHKATALVVTRARHIETCTHRARAKADAEAAARAAQKTATPAATAAPAPSQQQRPKGGQHTSKSDQSPNPIRNPKR